MPKLSIIIPVYNAGTNLEKTIESVRMQTFSDFELLLIDDGSTDGSGALCDHAAGQDERVQVTHQANAGVSAARNKGLAQARGEWVAFVDADDFIEPDMYQKMVEEMQQTHSTLVVCGMREAHYEGDKLLYAVDFPLNACLIEGKQMPSVILPLLHGCLIHSPANKLYHIGPIRKYRIRFDETVSLGEDLLFNLSYLEHVARLLFIEPCFYHYTIQQNSASLVARDRPDKFKQMTALYHGVCHYIKQSGSDEERLKEIANFLYIKWAYSTYMDLYGKASALTGRQRKQSIQKTLTKELCACARACPGQGGLNHLLAAAVARKNVWMIAMYSRAIVFGKQRFGKAYRHLLQKK